MSHDALEVVKLKRNFYRDSYRSVVMILFIAIIIIAVMAWIIVYQQTHKPAPKYFATTSAGQLIPMVPLDQPNLSDSAVLQWVSTAVTSLYTYDFLNFRSTFQANSQYFTTDGWRAFLSSLEQSRNLEAVQDKKLTVQAVPAGAPIILSENNINGIYTWQVQLPILVTYQSLSEEFNQNLLVTIVIQRLSTLDSEYGIGIAQLVVQQQS
ncbi:MAG: type IV secretion protein DotI [Gammaproteobacteria bacterium RIFCSPHIGHO2_12_FULL_35_23]|nr:MAG: type IV secretion protein DotI [Gammaproteobacteria bacterium RIFCSPHIGHO2_12_FULL_35_23]